MCKAICPLFLERGYKMFFPLQDFGSNCLLSHKLYDQERMYINDLLTYSANSSNEEKAAMTPILCAIGGSSSWSICELSPSKCSRLMALPTLSTLGNLEPIRNTIILEHITSEQYKIWRHVFRMVYSMKVTEQTSFVTSFVKDMKCSHIKFDLSVWPWPSTKVVI